MPISSDCASVRRGAEQKRGATPYKVNVVSYAATGVHMLVDARRV